MRKVIQINENNFTATTTENTLPMLLDIWQSNCSHCRRLVPVISHIAERYQGKLIVGQMQAGPHAELAESLNLRTYPTLVLFNRGRDVLRIEGFMPLPEIERQLAQYVS